MNTETIGEGFLLLRAAVGLRVLVGSRRLAPLGTGCGSGAFRTGQFGARLGGLLLDFTIGLGLGDGVIKELEVVLVSDGSSWGPLLIDAWFK